MNVDQRGKMLIQNSLGSRLILYQEVNNPNFSLHERFQCVIIVCKTLLLRDGEGDNYTFM
jgi:hypothetical protein